MSNLLNLEFNLYSSIAFLDAATLDLGDLDFSPLKKLGHFKAYPDTPSKKLLQRAKSVPILLTNKFEFHRDFLEQLPDLKLLCIAATGVNNVDLDAARECGIAVCNVKGYSTPTVAEHAMMFLLNLSHRFLPHHQFRKGWPKTKCFAMLNFPYGQLRGKVLGIVGYGQIGREVARLAKAFGMKVKVAALPGRSYASAKDRIPLNQLIPQCDYLTLHTALTEENKHLIDAKRLKLFKPEACLINLARGGLVVEKDIAAALQKKKLRAYATDVLEHEPPKAGHPFLSEQFGERLLLTPHVAWASKEARQVLVRELAMNIQAFLKGKKRNRVV